MPVTRKSSSQSLRWYSCYVQVFPSSRVVSYARLEQSTDMSPFSISAIAYVTMEFIGNLQIWGCVRVIEVRLEMLVPASSLWGVWKLLIHQLVCAYWPETFLGKPSIDQFFNHLPTNNNKVVISLDRKHISQTSSSRMISKVISLQSLMYLPSFLRSKPHVIDVFFRTVEKLNKQNTGLGSD